MRYVLWLLYACVGSKSSKAGTGKRLQPIPIINRFIGYSLADPHSALFNVSWLQGTHYSDVPLIGGGWQSRE
jgi:hypothetical protein